MGDSNPQTFGFFSRFPAFGEFYHNNFMAKIRP